jgi:hypothetical protein
MDGDEDGIVPLGGAERVPTRPCVIDPIAGFLACALMALAAVGRLWFIVAVVYQFGGALHYAMSAEPEWPRTLSIQHMCFMRSRREVNDWYH